MTVSPVLTALAGLGVVLFGVRGLVQSLDDSLVDRLRPALETATARVPVALSSGVLATLGLQASSVTVMTLMSLLQRSLVPLDKAIVVALGAAIGTTLKFWLFELPFAVLGPVLVGVSSVLLVVTRRYSRRLVLDVVFHLGLLYLGWHLVRLGTAPFLESPEVQAWLAARSVATLPGLMYTVAAGFLVTAIIQSSSTTVFVAITLASSGALSVPAAAALVLGANVGTTVTPLYASLEYRPEVRRLAVAYFLAKAGGVALVGLFFKSFLELVAGAAGLAGANTPGAFLCMAHTLFNAINAVLWIVLLPALVRVVEGRVDPGELKRLSGPLTAPVRRILVNVPEEAVENVTRERERLLRELKMGIDQALARMADPTLESPPDLPALRNRLSACQEMLAAVLVRHSAVHVDAFELLRELNTMDGILDELGALHERIDTDGAAPHLATSEPLARTLRELGAQFDGLWAGILEGPRQVGEVKHLAEWEVRLCRTLTLDLRISDGELLALGRQLQHLKQIWGHVNELAFELRTPILAESSTAK